MAQKKKEKRQIPRGKIFVTATFNNTIVTITDMEGNTVAWSSAGVMNFKGSRKSTPYAAQLASRDAVQKAISNVNMQEVEVYVKGPGIGRESAIRSIAGAGMHVNIVKDVTPLPHNGCRSKKKRRV